MTCAGMVSLTPSSPPFAQSTEQLRLQPNSRTSNSLSPHPHCTPLSPALQTRSTCWLADVLFVCVMVCLNNYWCGPCVPTAVGALVLPGLSSGGLVQWPSAAFTHLDDSMQHSLPHLMHLTVHTEASPASLVSLSYTPPPPHCPL